MSLSVRGLSALLAAGALALAGPAAAQQGEWRNPYTGRIWNNPHSSLIDTYLHNDQQRRLMMHHYGADPGRQPHPLEQAAAPGNAPAQAAPPARAMPQAMPRQTSADPSFRLVNRSAVTINEIYVSSSEDSQWGPDRLGRNVLPPGQAFIIRLPAGMCVNDVRVVYANGQAVERRGVNTCALVDLPLP